MNNKLNCQLVNILLDKNNTFSNKYTSIISGDLDYDMLLNDYYNNKDMRTIMIDNNTQSICFTNQKELVSVYNSETKRYDQYYEEVHIHCNNLSMFEKFTDYLKVSKYKDAIDETSNIPHYDSINISNLKNCELVMEPMTNEVTKTKGLLNLLEKNSDETIFRAISIHFGNLVSNNNKINFELIHKLNSIYKKYVENNDYSFFSKELSDKFLNFYNDENSHETKISNDSFQNSKTNDNKYTIYEKETNDYEIYRE